MHFPLASYDGYCADCDTERPLVLVEHGPRGLRAWFAGVGADDRALSYCCRLCGRNEHVPLTEAEDAEYDATLPTWPDTFFDVPDLPAPVTVVEPFVPVLVAVPEPVEVLPAELVAAVPVAVETPAPVLVAIPAPRPPVVRVISLPRQVLATDDLPLALAVA